MVTRREQLLRDGLARLIDMDASEVSVVKPFAELGVDSLIGLRFARRIADQLGVEFDLEWLYEHPNIRELCRFLDQRFGTDAGELLAPELRPELDR